MPEEEIRWACEPVGLRQAHRIGWVGPEAAPQAAISGRYRFQNFSRAFGRLQDALIEGAEALNELEQEGVIQRFEYTFELAWNTLKDRLEHDGVVLNPVTPRAVIRSAFQAKLISQGERWIDMLGDRNRMSHTYDSATFDEIIKEIEVRYLERLSELHARLSREMAEPVEQESEES